MNEKFSGDIVTPDAIEPILAIRKFDLYNRDEGGLGISSLTNFTRWDTGKLLTATCTQDVTIQGLRHYVINDEAKKVPYRQCQCGFYAMKRYHLLSEYSASCVGVVALWGKVLVGSRGYRAEHAKLLVLAEGSLGYRSQLKQGLFEVVPRIGDLWKRYPELFE